MHLVAAPSNSLTQNRTLYSQNILCHKHIFCVNVLVTLGVVVTYVVVDVLLLLVLLPYAFLSTHTQGFCNISMVTKLYKKKNQFGMPQPIEMPGNKCSTITEPFFFRTFVHSFSYHADQREIALNNNPKLHLHRICTRYVHVILCLDIQWELFFITNLLQI